MYLGPTVVLILLFFYKEKNEVCIILRDDASFDKSDLGESPQDFNKKTIIRSWMSLKQAGVCAIENKTRSDGYQI